MSVERSSVLIIKCGDEAVIRAHHHIFQDHYLRCSFTFHPSTFDWLFNCCWWQRKRRQTVLDSRRKKKKNSTESFSFINSLRENIHHTPTEWMAQAKVKVCAHRITFRINSFSLLVEIKSSFYARTATCALIASTWKGSSVRPCVGAGACASVCASEATIIVVIYIQAEQNVRIKETFENRMQFSMFEAPLCTSAIMQNCWLAGTKQWGRKFATGREHRALTE